MGFRVNKQKACRIHEGVFAAAFALSATAVSVAGAADADDGGGIEEVIVTAQRREQDLQQVPVAVTALTSEALERAQVESLQDYAALVPNFKATNYGQPGESDVSIRGVTNIGGQSSSIAVYNDEFGVNEFDFDLYDVERIEVLRGPQGTLFGRNTIAGAVNIVYKKPVETFEAAAELDAGSYDTYKASGMVNVPLSDTIFMRASGSYGESDGYLRDIGPAHASDDYESRSVRLALRGNFERLTLDLSVSHYDIDQGVPTAVPTGVLTPVAAGVIGDAIDDGQGFFPQNTRRISTDTPTSSDYKYDTGILRATYELDGANVVVIGGQQETRRDFSGDFDRTSADLIPTTFYERFRSRSLEARVESAADGQISWLAGGFYGEESRDYRGISFFTEEFQRRYFGIPPEVPSPIPGFRIDDNQGFFDKASVAVFGQIGWRSADDRINVDLSARYTRDTLDLIANDNAQTLAEPVSFDDSEEFTGFMPKVSVSFRATDDLMLFSTISRGYKSGGFNTAAGQVVGANPVYGKETATNYEVGMKSEFDQRLRINASVFVMKWDDIQVAQTYQDPTLRFFTFTQNAAKATLKGAEIEVAAVPFHNFDLMASLGYNDSKFDDFISAINSDGSRVDASDNRVPFSSKWQASLAGEYSLPIGSGALFLRGEYSYASDFYQTSINRDEIGYVIGSRRTINARAGWRADRYSITVYGENLGGDDEVYLWDVGNMLSGYQAVVRPERIGVKLTTSF